MSKLFTGFYETTEYEGEITHFEEIDGHLDIWPETFEDEAVEDYSIYIHPEEIPDIIKVLKKAYKRYKKEFNNG